MGRLLERENELSRIEAALADSRGGHGRCVLLEGPAGIGKTTLLGAARALALDMGLSVLTASGGELEVDFPFGVIHQLFATLTSDQTDRTELFTGAAALSQRVLVPASSVTTVGATGGASLFDSLHGLYWLTANLSATSPLLLVVDDAHWSDGSSLRFLLYLRRRLEGLPVMLLVAFRPGEPGAEERLVSQLVIDARNDVVRPPPLSEKAVGTMLADALAELPDRTFTIAAHAATTGNPFLVGELAAAMLDRRMRPTQEAAAGIASIGPEGVQRSIIHRLSRLPPSAMELARSIAIFGGGGVRLRQAAELAGLDENDAVGVVEPLVRAQILRDERQLSFVHPLVRGAVYEDIPRAARGRAHARAADLLTRNGASVDLVAAQMLESPPAADPTVVDRLRLAARSAANRGAMDVAATYLRRALDEPPDESQRASVLRELGTAELAAGEPDAAAERLAAAADAAGDLESRISIVLLRRHALVLADRIAEAVTVVDELAADAVTVRQRDLLDAAAVGAGQIDFEVVRSLQQRIADLRARAEHPGFVEPLGLAVAAAGNAFANGDPALTVAFAERAVTAVANAHPESDYSFEGQLVLSLWVTERYDRINELSVEWLERARRSGSLPRFISMATVRSMTSYRVGALADAESEARDALEAARLYGHQFWLPGAVAALINPLVDEDRLDEAEQILADTKVQERHAKSSAFCWTAWFLPARGRLHLAAGRTEDALTDFMDCGRYESSANRSPSLWGWRSEAALALTARGELGQAMQLADEEVALARAVGLPRALGVAMRASGLARLDDERVSRLTEAASVLANSSARLEQARTLIELGAALRRAGRRTDARAPLREGLELALLCAATQLSTRARDELLATGAHPRRERLSGPEALTPSERRIAVLAAEGRSNPEIAQTLFLTRRTVETHLTHVYQKLAISSRDALSAALEAPNLRGGSTM